MQRVGESEAMSIEPNPLCQRDGGRDVYRPGCYGRSPLLPSMRRHMGNVRRMEFLMNVQTMLEVSRSTFRLTPRHWLKRLPSGELVCVERKT